MLETTWQFAPPPNGSPPNSCKLHYSVTFGFKSALYSHLSQVFFNQVLERMVHAFLHRAEDLYGPPSVDHFNLSPEIISKPR